MGNFSNNKTLLLGVILTLLTGCQTLNSKVGSYLKLDTDLQIEFIVDADINPDEMGNASPLFIRLYELKKHKMIDKGDFIELYERDEEILGADLLAKHELKRFKPGESRTEHFVINKQANHVAVFAEFLDFKDSKFKLVFPVVANNVVSNKVSILVSGNELTLQRKR